MLHLHNPLRIQTKVDLRRKISRAKDQLMAEGAFPLPRGWRNWGCTHDLAGGVVVRCLGAARSRYRRGAGEVAGDQPVQPFGKCVEFRLQLRRTATGRALAKLLHAQRRVAAAVSRSQYLTA